MQVPAGWQIADGNADDIHVCGAYHWQKRCLVFANGEAYKTHFWDTPGWYYDDLLVQDEKGVRSKWESCDVLLRRRA
jgi:hypothetical protein